MKQLTKDNPHSKAGYQVLWVAGLSPLLYIRTFATTSNTDDLGLLEMTFLSLEICLWSLVVEFTRVSAPQPHLVESRVHPVTVHSGFQERTSLLL